ncbi:MAG: response regulator transcription factor [Lachnospiraceae bacterium]|nr:response regulator transcription factor [Lachnospiraceae bacterium]
MANVLICDDEKDIVSALEIYLGSEGYNIFKAYDGMEALSVMKENEIHLVLLDVMMPKLDGIKTIMKIREFSNAPVIFLTAKSEEADMILGLNVGADDYITKPFNPLEVQARVKSNLRRYMKLGSSTVEKDVLSIGGVELNRKTKVVTLDGNEISLTPTEFKILELFMSYPGEVFSPNAVYERIWKNDPYGTENIVAVHVRHLREKIEYDPANPRHLKVVWGQGYKMEE